MFLLIVPPIMEFLSSIEGYVSHSQIELSACNKVLWFTIWNIFFANVLSGSVFDQLDVFLEPKNIPLRLAVAVPAQVFFFFWGLVSINILKCFFLTEYANFRWKMDFLVTYVTSNLYKVLTSIDNCNSSSSQA